jgi:bifunctional non-homologous end joining protein LigD
MVTTDAGDAHARTFSRKGWLFEPKLDGAPCLVFRHDNNISLFSRNHEPLNLKYPELTEAFKCQKANFIVDGEIVTFVTFERGVTNFETPAANASRSAGLRRQVPVWFSAFDLLYFEN